MGGTGPTFHEGCPLGGTQHYSKKWDRLGNGYDTFTNISWTDDSLASRRVPFLFLVPKNAKGVPAAGHQLADGAYRVGHTKVWYSLYAFKSPAVSSKTGKLVPMLTYCEVVGQYTTHKRGHELRTVVQVYRQASNGVNVCNKLALQLRETNRM